MNKIIICLFFLSFAYALDCFSSWHKDNFNSQKGVYFISGLINKNNHFKLFIKNDQNNQKYRIDLIDKIIVGDKNKVSNYSKLKNQLFIEKSDSLFNEFIFSLLNLDQISNTIKKKGQTKYLFKRLTLGKAKIFLNKSCENIDSLIFIQHKNKMTINEIDVRFIENIKTDSLFSIDVNDEDVIKYDFR